jgi:hypothetical protein
MATLLVNFDGSAFNLFQQAMAMAKRGQISEAEVHKTMRELIATAKRRRQDCFLVDHLPARPRWGDVNFHLIEGWLNYREVHETLAHLLAFGRYLPIPERVRARWPKHKRCDSAEA